MVEENKIVKKVIVTKKPTIKKAPVKAAFKKEVVVKNATVIKKTQTSSKHNTVNITLVKSFHGRLPSHRATIVGLGLKRINHIKELKDTPEIRGMINKVAYLLKVED
ncbi:50S ribosomal protein L30 [Candidatus Ruthturnera calyptogenae]|uniref:50S ribosomal protein L30 n=1 Tax=Candidatus Ruthturnera calyptogenae TaxID=386487 RepID=UPI0004650D07|nr:50S ribosomal protein L30 [Candidatus Ruthturnera calyptogenae]